jgi:hypothetical protein
VKYFLAIFLLVAAWSCTKHRELSDEARAQVAADVWTMLHKYHDDIRLNGLVAEFAYLDSSDDFFWVPPGYSSPLSFDSVATIIRSNARLFRKVDNVWDSLRIIPHSFSLVTFTGVVSSTMTDSLGNSASASLIETGLAIKRAGGWKLLSGQTAVLQ